ncbi:MarR family winged helix-turn-helix transcriptional regulator [Luteococcus peritonei]|uniref:MarR family winged helix-turn-helix transcriptional regulator n=1 Tax=Luteococcus peritonei TaxID=88874 RepID=A0ABW4RX74_9ACTN
MNPLDRLLSQLRQANEAAQSAKDAALVDSGLTKAQYNALLLLARGNGSTASQLAQACGVSQQAMSQTVNRLVDASFVTAERSPHGGRAMVLTVTERGRSSLALADERVQELDDHLRQQLAPLEMGTFAAALDRLRIASLGRLK